MDWVGDYSGIVVALKEHLPAICDALRNTVPLHILAGYEGLEGARDLYNYLNSHAADRSLYNAFAEVIVREQIGRLLMSTSLKVKPNIPERPKWTVTGTRALDFVRLQIVIEKYVAGSTLEGFKSVLGVPAAMPLHEAWGHLRMRGKWNETTIKEVQQTLTMLGLTEPEFAEAFATYSQHYGVPL
jgi:hypothetical protein